MTQRELQQACAPVDARLRDVAMVIDRLASSMCMLSDEQGRLVGLLTDGDLRRAMLRGATLDEPALPHGTTSPQTVDAGTPRALVLDLMRALRIAAVPEIDEDRKILGLHTLSDVVGPEPLPNVAVIMAGGKGTRLGELTRDIPKPLMNVAGRSIIEWIVLTVISGGIREIYVSVNHMAEQIEEHLGDGSRLGCSIRYLRERAESPLGTAGSLRLLLEERPDLAHPALVMNGDLMVQFDAEQLLEQHRRQQAVVTVSIRSYQHQIPFGVVETDDRHGVASIVEKPTISRNINAGVYAVAPDAMRLLPAGRPSTMPELVQICLDRGQRIAAWRISSDWIDVGSPVDLARAKGLL